MYGELKTFEELLKLMPLGWEQKARELGALERSREVKDAKDLLLVNFLYIDQHTLLREDGGNPAVGGKHPSDQKRRL
jgi:hypothetical protein